MKKTIFTVLAILLSVESVNAAPSTLEVKKHGEDEIRHVVEPILEKYCRDQCKIIHVESEVDLAVDDLVTPGFEDHGGKVTLALLREK